MQPGSIAAIAASALGCGAVAGVCAEAFSGAAYLTGSGAVDGADRARTVKTNRLDSRKLSVSLRGAKLRATPKYRELGQLVQLRDTACATVDGDQISHQGAAAV